MQRDIARVFACLLLVLSACSVEPRSDDFACDTDGDCEEGRVCSGLGYCVVEGAGGGDAGGGGADASDGDGSNGDCPQVCDRCEGNTCVIECTENDECQDPIPCPDDLICQVSCSGESTCAGGIDCGGASECNVNCTAKAACGGEVSCPTGPCSIVCSAAQTCGGGVDCAGACGCEVDCSPSSTCAPLTCAEGCEEGGDFCSAAEDCACGG